MTSSACASVRAAAVVLAVTAGVPRRRSGSLYCLSTNNPSSVGTDEGLLAKCMTLWGFEPQFSD